ncbi:MAG: hypothetical protein R3A48_28020 [Polyangiales bacterium]
MRHAALAALVLCTTALVPSLGDSTPRRPHRGRRLAAAAPSALPDREDLGARRARALDAFARSGHIRRCWMQQLQRDATTPPRTLQFRLEVDAAGRMREVTVADLAAPRLARCLMAGAWSLRPLGPGEALQAQGTLRLDRGD